MILKNFKNLEYEIPLDFSNNGSLEQVKLQRLIMTRASFSLLEFLYSFGIALVGAVALVSLSKFWIRSFGVLEFRSWTVTRIGKIQESVRTFSYVWSPAPGFFSIAIWRLGHYNVDVDLLKYSWHLGHFDV